MQDFFPLLRLILFFDLQQNIIELVRIRHRLQHGLPLHASCRPRHELRAVFVQLHIPEGLDAVKPAVEWYEDHINQSKCVSSKVDIVAQLFFQQFEA